jgi:hypothetical protein
MPTSSENLLRALAISLRLLTVAQAAAWFCSSRSSSLRRMIHPLVKEGLILVESHFIAGPPEPEELLGNLMEMLAVARSKWRACEPRLSDTLRATERCANLFGGVAHQVRSEEASHDVALSAVWLAMGRPADWVKGDLAKLLGYLPGGKVPDAMLGKKVAVEVIGADYTVARLAGLARELQRNQIRVRWW